VKFVNVGSNDKMRYD